MGRKRGIVLGHVDFPLYTLKALGDRHFLVAGGGGQAKTGVPNAFEIFELKNEHEQMVANSVAKYDKENRAIMNCAVINNEKFFTVAAGMMEDCQMYRLKHKVVVKKTGPAGEQEGDEGIRKRKSKLTQAEPQKTSDRIVSFDVEPLDCVQTDFHPDGGFQKTVQFSMDNTLMATGGADGFLRIWKYPELKKLHEVEAHKDEIIDLDISPSGSRVITISDDKHCFGWDTKDGTKQCELKWSKQTEVAYKFRNCRYGLIEGKKDRFNLYTTHIPVTRGTKPLKCFLTMWDCSVMVPSPKKHADTGVEVLSSMAVSDDGTYIAVGTISGSVSVYIAFSLQRLYHVKEAHNIFVTGVEFLPSSESMCAIAPDKDFSLLSISVDNQIQLHQVDSRGSISALWIVFGLLIIFFFIFRFLATLGI